MTEDQAIFSLGSQFHVKFAELAQRYSDSLVIIHDFEQSPESMGIEGFQLEMFHNFMLVRMETGTPISDDMCLLFKVLMLSTSALFRDDEFDGTVDLAVKMILDFTVAMFGNIPFHIGSIVKTFKSSSHKTRSSLSTPSHDIDEIESTRSKFEVMEAMQSLQAVITLINQSEAEDEFEIASPMRASMHPSRPWRKWARALCAILRHHVPLISLAIRSTLFFLSLGDRCVCSAKMHVVCSYVAVLVVSATFF